MPALEVSTLVEEDRIEWMTSSVSLSELFFFGRVTKEHSTANASIVRLNSDTVNLKPLKGYLAVLRWRGNYAGLAFAEVCREPRLMSGDTQVIESTAPENSGMWSSDAI